MVTDAVGAVLVKTSFGAYGARRGTNWQGTPSSGDYTAIANSTRRGFTDHTMLDSVGLIHMNGRVQDPVLGRFISADPVIDGTDDTQGWNRYAYVQNRPLSAIDPSGFAKPHPKRDSRGDGSDLDDLEMQLFDANFGAGFMRACLLGNCNGPAAPGSAAYSSFADQAQSTVLAGFRTGNGAVNLRNPNPGSGSFQWIPDREDRVAVIYENGTIFTPGHYASRGGTWQYVPSAAGLFGGRGGSGGLLSPPRVPVRTPSSPTANSAGAVPQAGHDYRTDNEVCKRSLTNQERAGLLRRFGIPSQFAVNRQNGNGEGARGISFRRRGPARALRPQ